MSPSLSQRVGLAGLAARKAVAAALFGQALQQEAVVLVGALNGHAMGPGEAGSAAGMVQMAVGQEHLLERNIMLRNGFLEKLQIAAGIDHRRLHGSGAPQERAVLPERRHRHDKGLERQIGHVFRHKAGRGAPQRNSRAKGGRSREKR